MSNGAVIRDWARKQGYHVANRGRMSPDIHAAYRAAHGTVELERPQNAAACTKCGRFWTANREAHCTGCCRHFSSVRWFDDHMQAPDAKHERSWCRDPMTIPVSRKDPTLKYKIVASAWGDVYTLAAERPESFVPEEDGVLL